MKLPKEPQGELEVRRAGTRTRGSTQGWCCAVSPKNLTRGHLTGVGRARPIREAKGHCTALSVALRPCCLAVG